MPRGAEEEALTPRTYGILGGIAGHRRFTRLDEREVACECGARMLRDELSAHVADVGGRS